MQKRRRRYALPRSPPFTAAVLVEMRQSLSAFIDENGRLKFFFSGD